MRSGPAAFEDGTGTVDTGSGVGGGATYTAASRFGDGAGTNPEELIAAAHAACFSMALSLVLGKAGHKPESVETTRRDYLKQETEDGYDDPPDRPRHGRHRPRHHRGAVPGRTPRRPRRVPGLEGAGGRPRSRSTRSSRAEREGSRPMRRRPIAAGLPAPADDPADPLEGQRRLRARQQRRVLRVLRHGDQPLADPRGRARHPRRGGDRRLRRVALHLPGRLQRSPRRRGRACASASSATRASRYEIGLFAAGAEEPSATGLVRPRLRRRDDAPAGGDAPRLRDCLERLRTGEGAGDEGPQRGAARDGRRAAVLRVAAAGGRRARARPARARRAAGPGRRRRALPLRPLGDRRLAAAGDADGARARGGRRGRRGRRRASAASPPGDHVVLAFVPACGRLRAVPGRARGALRARAPPPTPPGRCSAASGGCTIPAARSSTTTSASPPSPITSSSRARRR